MSLNLSIRLLELIEESFNRLECKIDRIASQQEKLMSGFDDLNAAVTANTAAVVALTASVDAEITAVNAVIAALKAGGITDAQAEALAQTLQTSVTNLGAATTTLNNEASTAGQ